MEPSKGRKQLHDENIRLAPKRPVRDPKPDSRIKTSQAALRQRSLSASEADRLPRKTARGEATRARLVTAARTVFEDEGFVRTRVEDITKLAGTANGSFYTYFSSKEEILMAAASTVYDELKAATRKNDSLDPIGSIMDVNKRYVDTWVRNRKMLVTLHQAAGILPEFFTRLNESHRLQVTRHTEWLKKLQRQGLVDPTLDAYHTAVALGSMVAQTLRWCIGQREPCDQDIALRTLNTIWIRAIGLPNKQGPQRQTRK
jgi:AcrR family transcriptional regulator